MKHLRINPNRLQGSAVCAYMAAAFLSLTGWAVSSHADTDAAADSKKSNSDDLQEIVVVSYKITRGSVGSLVDAPVFDIPRNMVVLTEETLQDQMIGSTLDILENWAGVQRGQQTPGGEHPVVRGMTAYQFLEGSFSGGAIWDSAEFLGAAEFMTGPNSIQYGFLVQGGGAINYLLKRPLPNEYLDVTAQGNSWGDNKYVLDGNKPFDDGYAGDGVRVIGVHESIEEYEKGSMHGERNSIAAMVTYSGILGIKTELDAELLRRDAPAPEIISFSANPTGNIANINPRDSTLQPWENIGRDGYHLGAKLSRDIVGPWHAVADFADESEQVINKSCTLYDPNPVTGEGAYGCNTFGFQTYSNRTLRLDILGSFETFGIKHDVTFGSSQLRQLIELPPTFDTYGAAPYDANNLYDPRYYPQPYVPTSQSIFNEYRETQWWTQEYFQDRIQFDPHWDLWIGVNEGNNKVKLNDVAGLLAETHANGLSPSFSLSYSPIGTLRFYVTYADAISPGGQAPISPQYVNSGEFFGPMRLKSIETGVKWQVGSISELNLNYFNAQQPLAFSQELAPNEFLYTEEGKATYKGVEFTSVSKFPFGLTLNGNITLVKPLEVDTGTPDLNNKYVPGVSRESAAFYAEYKVPMVPKLGLTALVTYNSSTPLLATNGYNVSGYTLANLGGFYSHPAGDTDITYRMILSNAFDKQYYSPYFNTLSVGEPRTLTASVTVRFGGKD
jgi:iron complex outermembrane recepter protein